MNPGLPQIPDRISIDPINDLYNFAHHYLIKNTGESLIIDVLQESGLLTPVVLRQVKSVE